MNLSITQGYRKMVMDSFSADLLFLWTDSMNTGEMNERKQMHAVMQRILFLTYFQESQSALII